MQDDCGSPKKAVPALVQRLAAARAARVQSVEERISRAAAAPASLFLNQFQGDTTCSRSLAWA
jgi:hypothetical protein